MILTNVDGGFAGAGFKNNFGTLWMRQQWEMNAPIVVGQTYNITSKVLDVYEHRNRTVVNQEVTLWASDGSQVAQGHHHQSFMIDQSSGKVALRDPKAKGGMRRFEIPAGESVESVDAVISLEMCGKFFHGNANYHTNKEAALELGFEEVVVGGRMTLSYIGDMMDKQFGKGWYEGGSLDIKFTNIVWPDDHIIAKGVITGTEKENGDTKASVAVWMEKKTAPWSSWATPLPSCNPSASHPARKNGRSFGPAISFVCVAYRLQSLFAMRRLPPTSPSTLSDPSSRTVWQTSPQAPS